jgi:HK97 gp10 family phage protein
MISFKIEGIGDVIKSLEGLGREVTSKEFDKVVKDASIPIVEKLKAEYEPLRSETGKASRDTHIGDSVRAFQRKKTGKGTFYAYYIGPDWKTGGQLAYILEYGTAERFKANTQKGGIRTSGGRIYGATKSTGRVKPLGIVRRTYDTMEGPIKEKMFRDTLAALRKLVKENGLELK